MNIEREKLAVHNTQKYPLTFSEGLSENDLPLLRRYQNAWNLAGKAATLLKEQFGAKKVVIFGSLTKRSWFNPWSDIDLAVWDIPDNKFYAAVGAVTGLDSDFKVDLVDAKTCCDSLRKAIEDGIEL